MAKGKSKGFTVKGVSHETKHERKMASHKGKRSRKHGRKR